MNEAQLAKHFIKYLEELKFEVYQEVRLGYGLPRADMVGLYGKILYVIEVKKSIGINVIEQALYWRNYSNFTSVATLPRSSKGKKHFSWSYLIKPTGLGWLTLNNDLFRPTFSIQIECKPKLFRSERSCKRLRDILTPGHKFTGEAGNALNEYYTPFKNTCEMIADYLKVNGPTPVAKVMKKIDHHYKSDTSAKSNMLRWSNEGLLSKYGISSKKDGRKILFYFDASLKK